MELPSLPSLGSAWTWFTGVCTAVLAIYVPQLMKLRRASSRDSAARAHDEAQESRSGAEKEYFETAVKSAEAREKSAWSERDAWRRTADEAWTLLRKAEATVARHLALQESHERQMLDKDKQIDKLWKLVIRFAPAGVKEALEAEYSQTRPTPLDALPPSRKGSP